ncbi:MAG TPA: winged helix-turn-helix domain-containing protein [Candidatus Limnocylindrales bacterium]|nr:winged helix-turn-helix domain-containing protein [Candidatus Limnocylindrales bacterium]
MQEFGKIPKNPEKRYLKHIYEFGPFRLNPQKRILLREGEVVALTPKALEILLALVENHGEVLVKEELMQDIWPDTIVEEGNLNRNISTLRKVLGELPNDHRYIVTVPGRGYQFVAEVRDVLEEHSSAGNHGGKGGAAAEAGAARAIAIPAPAVVRAESAARAEHARPGWLWLGAAVAAIALIAIGILKLRAHARPALSETDTVLLADFANKTGDPVFDDTLKQAVSVQLGQSPYLNILSDAKARGTLRLMTRPTDTKLTPEVAREVCQRSGSKAYIAGSIASLGTQYVIELEAVNCQSGDALAREQATAQGKERVLSALDGATAKLREKLGESLKSVQKFDTPLAEATTASLEALQAYSVGTFERQVNDAKALPSLKRAVELDPEFASAYEALGVCYFNLGQPGLGRENFTKAFELHDRVSERERFVIAARYYEYVTGDLHKAIETYQLWAEAYPRSPTAHANLGSLYGSIGQFERAIPESVEGVQLEPDAGAHYANLVLAYAALERYDDAEKIYKQALARQVEDPILRVNWFGVAFVKGDQAEMDALMKWSAGKPEAEDNFLAAKSDTEAFGGHLEQARVLSREAVASAVRSDQKETAAQWKMDEAIIEAEFGNTDIARREAAATLASTSNHDSQILAAVTFARAGDPARAQAIASDLAKNYPLDTLVNEYWLPVIRAAIEISRNNPAKAVDVAAVAVPYELASPQTWPGTGGPLYPAYLRGQAFLMMRRGADAAKEYQKVVDHRGFMLACPLSPLARVGLARAYVLLGDTAKARAAYQEFFTLWKDADPEIPILRTAKSEYAGLK